MVKDNSKKKKEKFILGIDTSGKICSVALSNNDVIIGKASNNAELTHSQKLMPLIEKLLFESNVTLQNLYKIAVAVGPGSYTGLRIGISTAKGIAFGLGIKCIGISTLKALTFNVKTSENILAIMKARADLVYAGGYIPDQLIPKKLLAEQLLENTVFVGDGAVDFFEEYGRKSDTLAENLLQNAESICLCAKNISPVSPLELKPVYLQEFHLN
ncbi:hypothetical protein FACS1894132_11410 [Clostridia bacterium]|nr:hypothetical protein FACS1894132_11410 [Clostridia bacterium]